ncbi:FAD-binding protein, partial [Lactobacillus sp. XV13L]|nr:FAD-binding protein [Lactobacillus sp. XV13L]
MAEVEEKDTVIIGAGPGGYVAAIRAAELGQKVTVIEKDKNVVGVCLNVRWVPSKALIQAGHRLRHAEHSELYGISTGNISLDFYKLQEWKDTSVIQRMTNGVKMLLKKHKVEVIYG